MGGKFSGWALTVRGNFFFRRKLFVRVAQFFVCVVSVVCFMGCRTVLFGFENGAVMDREVRFCFPIGDDDVSVGGEVRIFPHDADCDGMVRLEFVDGSERSVLVLTDTEAKRIADGFDAVFSGLLESQFCAGVLIVEAGWTSSGAKRVLLFSDDHDERVCFRIECGIMFSHSLRNMATLIGYWEQFG